MGQQFNVYVESKLKWQICIYGLFYLLFITYFMSTIQGYIKINALFSIISTLFFLLSACLGFLSLLTKRNKFNIFFTAFIILQLILTIFLLILCIVWISSNDYQNELSKKYSDALLSKGKNMSDLDDIQKCLKCCSIHVDLVKKYLPDNFPINEPTPFIPDYNNPTYFVNSCCPVLDKNHRCKPELIYRLKCNDAYYRKLIEYKCASIFMFTITILFVALLFYTYKKNLNIVV